MLKSLGFFEYAEKVRKRKEAELNNIEEIKSRQEVRADLEKYLQVSEVNRFTTYINIKSLLKDGKKLQERVSKYRLALGKNSEKLEKTLEERILMLSKQKDKIDQDMSDVWDDLYEVKSFDDIESLLEQIALVLQKGLSATDQEDFVELQVALQQLLDDLNEVKNAAWSRKQFDKISSEITEKYQDSELEFDVQPILEEVIDEIKKNLDIKENTWCQSYLSLGDRKRKTVHSWLNKTEELPEYLSEETVKAVSELKVEAEQIIKEGKIEDVLYYFDKLEDSEKVECFNKMQEIINHM